MFQFRAGELDPVCRFFRGLEPCLDGRIVLSDRVPGLFQASLQADQIAVQPRDLAVRVHKGRAQDYQRRSHQSDLNSRGSKHHIRGGCQSAQLLDLCRQISDAFHHLARGLHAGAQDLEKRSRCRYRNAGIDRILLLFVVQVIKPVCEILQRSDALPDLRDQCVTDGDGRLLCR